MKKIVPYKKEVEFKGEVSEITSISLDNTLKKVSDYFITGEFIVSGEYKVTDVSLNTEKFEFDLPFDINIDKKYNTDELNIDIDDFYYELNKNKMIINISVLLDNLEEIELIKEEVVVEQAKKDVLDNISFEEAYRTYKVYIVRENDTLDTILEKFNVTKEELEDYNDLNKITVGLKVIIPTNNDEKV